MALTARRTAEYSWGGKSSAIGWDPRWGKPTRVTAVINAQTDDGGYTLICTVTVEISSSGTGSSGGGSIGGGGSSGGGSSSGGSSSGGSSSGGSTGGTTGGNTSGSISAGGTGNTAYGGCKHDKNCPIYPFKDAFTDAWYHDGGHYCIDNGLMGGYGDGKFGPNDFITREQFAAMLYRFAQLQGKDVSRGDTNTLNGYTDAGTISSYALTAMKWANGMGVISGTDNSTLMPKGNATRAQAACMIQRYIINLAK